MRSRVCTQSNLKLYACCIIKSMKQLASYNNNNYIPYLNLEEWSFESWYTEEWSFESWYTKEWGFDSWYTKEWSFESWYTEESSFESRYTEESSFESLYTVLVRHLQ